MEFPSNATPISSLRPAARNGHAILPSNGLVTMRDVHDASPVPGMRCFWDHHPFASAPVGCPVRYTPPPLDGKAQKGVYYVDGYFCSFNCALAFAHAQFRDAHYSQSEFLLRQLAREARVDTRFSPAPHWRLLKAYGGWLSVEELRESCGAVHYNDRGWEPLANTIVQQGVKYEQEYTL